MRLRYTCEVCGKDIADGTGGIAVSYSDIHEVEEGNRRFDEEHAIVIDGVRVGGTMYTAAEALAERPTWAHWWTIHWDCKTLRNPYDFGVEDIRSHLDVLNRVTHLLEKDWLQSTDLSSWLYRLPDVGAW